MGRKRKYDYEAARIDYERGMFENEICAKYGMPRGSLTRIATIESWDSSNRQQRATNKTATPSGSPVSLNEWKKQAKRAKKNYDTLTGLIAEVATDINEIRIHLKDQILEGEGCRIADFININNALGNFMKTASVVMNGQRLAYAEEVSALISALNEKEAQQAKEEKVEQAILKKFADKKNGSI